MRFGHGPTPCTHPSPASIPMLPAVCQPLLPKKPGQKLRRSEPRCSYSCHYPVGSHLSCRSSSSTLCHLELTGPPLLPHLPHLLHPPENSGLQCFNNHTEVAGILDPKSHKNNQGREWSKEQGGTEVRGWCCVWCTPGTDPVQLQPGTALLCCHRVLPSL